MIAEDDEALTGANMLGNWMKYRVLKGLGLLQKPQMAV